MRSSRGNEMGTSTECKNCGQHTTHELCGYCFMSSLDLNEVYGYLIRIKYDDLRSDGVRQLLGVGAEKIIRPKTYREDYRNLLRKFKASIDSSQTKAALCQSIVQDRTLLTFLASVARRLDTAKYTGQTAMDRIEPGSWAYKR